MDRTHRVNRKGRLPGDVVQTSAGHFGEFVQGRLGPDGPLALVTLPAPRLTTHVRFAIGDLPLRCEDPHSAKLCRAARILLDRHGLSDRGGLLQVSRPVQPAQGAGSSTADVLATLRAVACTLGISSDPETQAAICLEVDGAVDPLMFPGNVLFAPRQAQVLRDLPDLPPMTVIGAFAGDGRPTDPLDHNFPDMRKAFDLLEDGCNNKDLGQLARAAHISALANQDRNPNPLWDMAVGMVGKGALGPVVSHTGSAIGLIFPPVPRGKAYRLKRSMQDAGFPDVRLVL